MFEWIGIIFSSLFYLLTSSLTHNSTFTIITQQIAPAIQKNALTAHGATETEILTSISQIESNETVSVVVKFIASVFGLFEPVVSLLLHLTAIQTQEDHLLDVLEDEPPSPTDTLSSDSSDESFVEEELKPARKRSNSFSVPTTTRDTNPPPNDSPKRSRSSSCISMGCLFKPSTRLNSFNLASPPQQPLRLKAKRQCSKDNLLTKLGKNHINRKLVAIKDLYPLLNLRQPPTPAERQVRTRRSDEDLSFLEDMHKVMRVLSMDFDRPSHSYDISRIITIPSLADVLVSEEHLLKAGVPHFPICTSSVPDVFAFFSGYGPGYGHHYDHKYGYGYSAGSVYRPYHTFLTMPNIRRWSMGSLDTGSPFVCDFLNGQATLDVVATLETPPVRRASRGLGLNGGFVNSSVHPSLSKLERDMRFRTLKDSWITWGLARRPDVTCSMRQELESLLGAPIIVPAGPVGGPIVHELPVFTAVVKEGLRRRSAAASFERGVEVAVEDVTTATMLAAKGGQKSFADPQTYDPMRWLPPPMVNSSKRHPLTTDIPKNQCERDKLLANLQIYAVTPPIVKRNSGDISTSSIDLVIITPKSKLVI